MKKYANFQQIIPLALGVALVAGICGGCGAPKKEEPMQYTLSRGELTIAYDPRAMALRVNHNGMQWDWLPKACAVELPGGKRLAFERARCDSELVGTEECVAVRSRYRRQRSTFADGTTVTIDLDRDSWEIACTEI